MSVVEDNMNVKVSMRAARRPKFEAEAKAATAAKATSSPEVEVTGEHLKTSIQVIPLDHGDKETSAAGQGGESRGKTP